MADSVGSADWRDANFAANMVRLRTAAGMSQADLVKKLRNAPSGVRWDDVHPTTISRIEKGERQVRLSEAFSIALALDADPVAMTYLPKRAALEERIDREVRRIVQSYNAIGYSVHELVESRHTLRRLLAQLQEAADLQEDGAEKQRLEHVYAEAKIYLSLRVDAAIRAGREAKRDIQGPSDFERMYGITPFEWNPEYIDQEDIDASDA